MRWGGDGVGSAWLIPPLVPRFPKKLQLSQRLRGIRGNTAGASGFGTKPAPWQWWHTSWKLRSRAALHKTRWIFSSTRRESMGLASHRATVRQCTPSSCATSTHRSPICFLTRFNAGPAITAVLLCYAYGVYVIQWEKMPLTYALAPAPCPVLRPAWPCIPLAWP